MTKAWFAELSEHAAVAAVRAYSDAVGRRTREGVETFDARRWDEVIGPADVARATAAGARGPRAARVADVWQGGPLGGPLGRRA